MVGEPVLWHDMGQCNILLNHIADAAKYFAVILKAVSPLL
jgi:hypothetical protein